MELRLSPGQSAALEAIVARPQDVQQLKRAQGLLAVAQGEPVVAIARRLQVCRDTVYEWIQRFRDRTESLPVRLRDRSRPGRPDTLFQGLLARLPELVPQAPSTLGYRHAEWTTGLLQAHLASEGIEVSDASVRRALHHLGYRWKRPRFVLSRRSPTWRQAKGGYGAD
jgi:transposase